MLWGETAAGGRRACLTEEVLFFGERLFRGFWWRWGGISSALFLRNKALENGDPSAVWRWWEEKEIGRSGTMEAMCVPFRCDSWYNWDSGDSRRGDGMSVLQDAE